ncbi:hypothetical protein M8J76_012158 [Diaphorina citri]|nr:hypothetical protein M8J76_012158 [Diaphorina citri]
MECTDCNGKLPKNGNYVHCHACGGDYHYTCTSLSEKSYKSMSKPKKLEWKCLECRKINASQMSTKSSTRKKSESENSDCESDISDFLARRTRKSKVHDNEKVSDKSMEQLFEQFENRLWKKMSKKLSDIEEFMGFASSKIDDFSKLMKDIQKKQVTMEVAQEKLRQENMELKSKCKALEIGLNENAQLFNRNKLEITNIPTTVTNPKEVVAKVLEKVNGEKIDEKSYGTELRLHFPLSSRAWLLNELSKFQVCAFHSSHALWQTMETIAGLESVMMSQGWFRKVWSLLSGVRPVGI